MKNNKKTTKEQAMDHESTTTTWNFLHLVNNLNRLNTSPPYQRGSVWKNAYKHELIRSSLRHIPINTLHLVEQSPDASNLSAYWVLDGKQRIETISNFVQGNFYVEFEGQNIYWNDIINSGGKASHLLTKLDKFNISVVIWSPMEFEKQRDIFNVINYSANLNYNEKIYCEYFLTQKLLKELWDDTFGQVLHVFKNTIKNNKRFSALRWLNTLLLLCYGKDLKSTYQAKDLNAKDIKSSCKNIEDSLIYHGFDSNMQYHKVLEKITELESIRKDLKMMAKWLEQCVHYKNYLKKNIEDSLAMDIVTFLIKNKQNKIFTNSFIAQHPEEFFKFLCEWSDMKNQNPQLKRRCNNKSNVINKHKLMDNLFGNLGLDLGVKKKSISAHDKRMAALTASSNCPISGIALSDNNVQYDHVKAKSTNSETKIVAISDSANNRKSDLTLTTATNIKKYMTEND